MSFPDGPPTPDLGMSPARRGQPVTQGELVAALTQVWAYLLAQEEIINKIGERQVATQSDVDALTAALAQEDSDLNAAVSGIQAEIDSLKAANPSLDLSALSAQVDATKAAVAAAAALVPAPAAPPADGGSAPSA